MTVRKTKDIEKLLADDAAIEAALTKGVRDALRRHKQAGVPVVEWREGRPVWVTPEDIELDETPSRSQNMRPKS